MYENSQTFAAVRRWLVVCPLPWLLPRISRGQCFLKGPRRPVSAGDARFSLPAWHLGRMFFCSSLTAPLLYRIKMEFLCEEFEQIENKRSRCTSFCTAAPFFTIFQADTQIIVFSACTIYDFFARMVPKSSGFYFNLFRYFVNFSMSSLLPPTSMWSEPPRTVSPS